MNVVAISNEKGEVTDGELLADAERVHRQLRPHIADYATRVKEVLADGAEMAVVLKDGHVVGVAVFRIVERTHSGRELYCDDLVTDEAERSSGVGHLLMQYMERVARERDCDTFALDSGTQRQLAHRFYFREGLTVSSFHFTRKVSSRNTGIKVS